MDKDEIINILLNATTFEETNLWAIYRARINREDDSDADGILEEMEENDLIKQKGFSGLGYALTKHGDIVKKEGGWIEYSRKNIEKANKPIDPPTVIVRYEKHWYDTPIKIVGFISFVFATYFGISDKYNERTIHELTDINNRQESAIDSLTKEVLNHDTVLKMGKTILKKHLIDSLTNSLKVKK